MTDHLVQGRGAQHPLVAIGCLKSQHKYHLLLDSAVGNIFVSYGPAPQFYREGTRGANEQKYPQRAGWHSWTALLHAFRSGFLVLMLVSFLARKYTWESDTPATLIH